MNTKHLKTKILDLAIRGKLVPQDPSEGNAADLLKKIREEKNILIEQKKIKADKNSSFIIKIASRFVRNFFEKSHSNQAASCSFSHSIFCSRRVSALM